MVMLSGPGPVLNADGTEVGTGCVRVGLEEGLRALGPPPPVDGCRRAVTDLDDNWHEVRMAFCSNPGCAAECEDAAEGGRGVVVMSEAPDMLRVILHGGRPPAPLMWCSACKNAQYCSQACQRRHWGTHRSQCGALKGRLDVEMARVRGRVKGATVRLGRDWRGALFSPGWSGKGAITETFAAFFTVTIASR
jgi:hypothetical protein